MTFYGRDDYTNHIIIDINNSKKNIEINGNYKKDDNKNKKQEDAQFTSSLIL